MDPMQVLAAAQTQQEYSHAFEDVARHPEGYADHKMAWRLAASMDRADVLAALLSCNQDPSFVAHAKKWATGNAKTDIARLIASYEDAASLQSTTPPPGCPEIINRL